MIEKTIRNFREQSLYLNSIYLIMSTSVLAVSGFAYWWLAARLSSSYDLGIAATLVSLMTYIGMVSQIGLNIGIIRFLPRSQNQSGIVNTCITVVVLLAGISSIGFLFISNLVSVNLSFLHDSPLIAISFIVFMMFAALNVIIENIFIAVRKSINVFIKNSVLSVLKVSFLFFFLSLGGYGIFASWAVALMISATFSYFLFPSELRQKFRFQILKGELKTIAAFSTANYFAGLAGNLSISAIPIILTSISGPESTAYYAVPMSYASLLFSVPISICNSLFAEGAANEQEILKSTMKAIRLICIFLFPAIALLLIFGKYALLFFGADYARHSVYLLSILALSSIFVAINTVCWTLLNFAQRVAEIMITLGINAVLILTLTYLWTNQGLMGTGLAWLVGQGVTSLIYVLFVFKYFSWKKPLYGGMPS
jgi:O-antigen/teichoic acid export membrane protein